MKIFLLSHERELLKKTGTGQIVKQVNPRSTEIVLWKRKEPNKNIESNLSIETTALVYPGGESEEAIDLSSIENFILLDGTWQEANKIYNRSPYLKRYKKLSFSNNYKSTYNLRRNQKKSGLCTVESVIELYRLKGYNSIVQKLENAYDFFKSTFKKI